MSAPSSGMNSYKTSLWFAAFGTNAPTSGTLAEAIASLQGLGYTALAEVISVNGIAMSPSVTKITNLTSPAKAHEKVPGITDAGQIQFKFNYSAAVEAALVALQPDDTDAPPDWGRLQFVVLFPDGGGWYATAFVQASPFDVPEDDRITSDATLEVSGRPDFF